VLLSLAMYATLWRFAQGTVRLGPDSFFARTFRFNLVSLSFALLLPWASQLRLTRSNAISRSVRAVALWSYALYLTHIPLFAFVRHCFENSPMPALFVFGMQLSAALIVSAAVYRFYEAPCTRLRERIPSSRSA
jgi:peptidoglycan/LPS O-acetylase OafA/YrhL